MRPRVMSYGVISTWTLSPGRMRLRCIRIFPELCARTVYPFSNSTRNMALGRGSTTVPSTVNASSFGLLRFSLLVTSLQGVQEQMLLHEKISESCPEVGFLFYRIFLKTQKRVFRATSCGRFAAPTMINSNGESR